MNLNKEKSRILARCIFFLCVSSDNIEENPRFLERDEILLKSSFLYSSLFEKKFIKLTEADHLRFTAEGNSYLKEILGKSISEEILHGSREVHPLTCSCIRDILLASEAVDTTGDQDRRKGCLHIFQRLSHPSKEAAKEVSKEQIDFITDEVFRAIDIVTITA